MGEEVGEIHYLGVRILGNTHYSSDRRAMACRLGLNLDSFELLLDNTELDGYTILKVMPDTNDCYKYPLVRVKDALDIDVDNPTNRYYSCELITRNKDEFIYVSDLIHYPLVRDYPLLRGYAKGVLLYDNLIKQRVNKRSMKKIEIFDTLTLRHRKLIMEMLRVHKYRSQRVNHFKMFQAISVPALQAEEDFKKDNPALFIRLVYKKVFIIMTPTIYVLANRLVYKMHVTVIKDNKTINSHTGIINNILLRY